MNLILEMARKDRKLLIGEAVENFNDFILALSPPERKKALAYLVKGDEDEEAATAFKTQILPKLKTFDKSKVPSKKRETDPDVLKAAEDPWEEPVKADYTTKHKVKLNLGDYKGERNPSKIEDKSVIVNARMMQQLLIDSYKIKKPIFIFGKPGIGKTQTVRTFAKKIAASKGREFIYWPEADEEQQRLAIEHPDQFFMLNVIPAADVTPGDFIGIYDVIAPGDRLKMKKHGWILFGRQESADGIIFFDELNRSKEETKSSLLHAILEKMVGDNTLSENISIIAAGNPLGTKGVEDAMGEAMINRMGIVHFQLSLAEWIEWAEEHGIHEDILEFMKIDSASEKYFYQKEDPGEDKPFYTPRSISEFSDIYSHKLLEIHKRGPERALGGMNFFDWLKTTAAGKCGDMWAADFTYFVQYMSDVNYEEVTSGNKQLNFSVGKGENPVNRSLAVTSKVCGIIGSALAEELEKTQDFGKLSDTEAAGRLVYYMAKIEPEKARTAQSYVATSIRKPLYAVLKENDDFYTEIISVTGANITSKGQRESELTKSSLALVFVVSLVGATYSKIVKALKDEKIPPSLQNVIKPADIKPTLDFFVEFKNTLKQIYTK